MKQGSNWYKLWFLSEGETNPVYLQISYSEKRKENQDRAMSRQLEEEEASEADSSPGQLVDV